MQASEFAAECRQHLVAISGGGVAYLPPGLPPDLALTRDLHRTSDEARGAVGELVGMARAMPDIADMVEPFYVLEAMASTSIEGVETEVIDVLAGEVAPQALRLFAPNAAAGEVTSLNVQEVRNARETSAWGAEKLKEGRPLSVSFFRELHGSLMRGVRGERKSPGSLRTNQAYIKASGSPSSDRQIVPADARFVPPPPEHVIGCLEDLARFLTAQPTYGDLIDAAIAHYQFEAIHPFEDGNGRLGRILIALILIDRGILDSPLLPLSISLLRRKSEYENVLLAVSTHAEWAQWVEFFLESITEQAREAIERLGRLDTLRKRYQDSLVGLRSKVPHQALTLLFGRPLVSVPMVAEHTRTTYPTAKSAVEVLAEHRILVPYRTIAGTQFWLAEEVVQEVFEP